MIFKPTKGYSLPELLAVLTILSIVSIFIFNNVRNFRQDQDLKIAANSLQSQIRSAQTNAITNLKCLNQSNKGWQVKFSKRENLYQVETQCHYNSSTGNDLIRTIKTDKLAKNIVIDKLTDGSCGDDSCKADVESASVIISFSPVEGKVNFEFTGFTGISAPTKPINSWTKMQIVLKIGQNLTKSATVEKQGLIYVE